MEPIVAALRAQVSELHALVVDLDDEGWARPSACDGWSISDVLLHLAQTNDVATASVQGRFEQVTALWADAGETETVDDTVEKAIAASRGRSGTEVFEWWQRSAAEMAEAMAAIDPRARVQWVVGHMAARTLATTRLSETWIHTGDVADGLGVTLVPTDRLWHIARLVQRTVPYTFARAGAPEPGPVRFELTAPSDPSVQWTFGDKDAATVVMGSAHDLCRVAGQRAAAADTALAGTGPDAETVLQLMRTFA